MTVTTASTPSTNGAKRKTALTALSIGVLVLLGGYAVYEFMVARNYQSTDNAYVQANVVQITPQISGTVRALHADDTDFVKAGQPLVSLDPVDSRVALARAESQLGQTVRQVRTLYANNGTLQSQVQTRQADIDHAKTELSRLQDDAKRRAPLVETGAVGREEYDHIVAQISAAKSTLTAAESALAAAHDQLTSNEVLTDGVGVDQHPDVLRAAASVRESYLALHRTELLSPVDGWVARRSVQLGQRVAAGSPLMAVVGLRQVWVDANFKEGQLNVLRIGQPVKLVADVYGDKVEFDGKVQGLGAGTGAAFALLPAQNATGNWIKVVQRLPVRIELDPKQVAEHPLRVGLSMNVTVDVHDQSGAMLTSTENKASATETQALDVDEQGADADVARIIKANDGRGLAPVAQAVKTTQAAKSAKPARHA